MRTFLLPAFAHGQTPTLGLQNPLGGHTLVCALKGFIGGIYLIGTPVVVLMIVIAGLFFVLARGNSSKLEEAKKHLLWVLGGAALFLASWLLAQVLMNTANLLITGAFSGIASC